MVDLGSDAKTRSYTGERREVLDLVGRDRVAVLDLGCATGALGQALKERQPCEVVGVEFEQQMADVARTHLDHVVHADLNDWATVDAGLDDRTFDCVVCADVLEHVVEPWDLLDQIVRRLRPGGQLVLSLPNVGHIDTIWNVVIRRTWPHRDRGIHDRTHLRWFASSDVARLVDGAGLELKRFDRVFRLVERPAPINRRARHFAVPGLRELLTFQFLVVAEKPASAGGG